MVFKRGKPDLWEKLRREADQNGYVIKVIVYLRRQDGLAESWWNQKVKNGQREYSTASWEEFMQDTCLIILYKEYSVANPACLHNFRKAVLYNATNQL